MTSDILLHRRTFLARSGLSLGAAALGTLIARDAVASVSARGAIHPLHHPPRAKAVIFLCLAGGPSHLETFDEKPLLAELDGKEMPESVTAGQPIAQLQRWHLRFHSPALLAKPTAAVMPNSWCRATAAFHMDVVATGIQHGKNSAPSAALILAVGSPHSSEALASIVGGEA